MCGAWHSDVAGKRTGIGAVPGRADLDGIDALPQPRRQHLPHCGQGPRGRLLDARARPDGDPQRHGQLLVEQQWRQLTARFEPVAAVGALDRLHWVTQLAQPVDVAAHCPLADAQPLGEQAARPVTAGLQQGQQ